MTYSEEISQETERREFSRRTDVLPEISWKGTLGHPPAEFANSKLVTTKKPRPDLSEVSDEQIFAEFWKRMGRMHDEHA